MHRRAGKSVFAINYTIHKGIYNPLSNPQYALISPLLSQSKRNLWDELKRYTKNFPRRDIHENEMRVDIWRAEDDRIRIQLFGAENPSSLDGYRLDGVFIDEAQDHSAEFFGKTVRPMLSDRRGWALFMGTVRGRTYFYKLRERYREKMLAGDPDYFEASFKASETGIVPPAELKSALEEMGPELYNQEYELSAESPNKGSYYSEYLLDLDKQGHVTNIPYDPRLPVQCGFDLGMDDHTAIWFFQQVGLEIRFIDYYECTGEGIPQICNKMRSKNYGYGTILLPHDAAVRELGTGKSREEIFRSQGFNTQIVKRQSIADGIQAVRAILPRSWFDKIKCQKGLDALKEYSRAWNEKEQIFDSHPRHDWSSHGADAARCLAMGIRERHNEIQRPMKAEVEYDYFL